MADSEPAYLTVGTEVSAKFKGAFCEAKIKKVTKKIRCKVVLKEHPFGTLVVENHQIKGDIYEVNHVVDVIQGKSTSKAVIQQVKDCSSYDVVFNDGDEKTLRRTQLCLKGGRHFDEKVSLDSLPLYNPEQWINNPHLTKSVEIMPKDLVKKLKRRKAEETPSGKRKKREESDDEGAKKREKRAAASAASVAIEEMDQGDTEISGDGSSSAEASDVEKERDKERKKQEMDRREKSVHKSPEEKSEKYTAGDVICYYEDPAVRGKWLPGIVVSRKIYKTTPKPATLTKKDYPVRLFTNGRYYKATLKQLSLFEDHRLRKKALEAMNTNMKVACERAQAFLDKEALPATWKRNEVFDDEEPSTSKEKEPKDEKKKEVKKDEKKKEKEKEKKVESESSSEEESEDEASAEERDLFVAQLYKFQEDRGTPINRAPVLGGKDIDLYRFYQVVQNYGGAKRVTANGEWKKVLIKLKLEGCPGATPVTVRKAYGRYLAHFNSFYKSLGAWTQSSSGNGTASPRDRRVLLRGPTEDKKKKKKSTGDKKKDDEKESTVEKESSIEPKEEKEKKKEEKKDEKKTVEKAKEPKTEKIERTHSISEKEKKEEKEKAKEAAAKVKEEKKEAEKKKEEKPKRKKEDSESTAEPESTSGSRGSRAPSIFKKSESTNDEDEDDDDDYDLPFKGKRPKGYEDDAESTEWLAADIFVHFYLGQKVRAWHHGKWYEARVVNFHQAPRFDMLDVLKKHENTPEPIIPADIVRYLTRHIQDTRVFVHYLGWNSRYDENVSLAKLKCEAKDVESSLAYYHPGCAPGEFIHEPFLKRCLAFVRGPQGILSLKREHTKGGGLGVNGYRPRRITREKYEQILAAELSHKPESKRGSETSSPAVSSPTPTASHSTAPKDKSSEAKAAKAAKKEPEETEDEEEEEDEKEELPGPSRPQSTATPSVASPAPSASPVIPVEKPKEEIKEEIKEKTPKEPTPVASPRLKRQRTISTTSNRTASPAVITTPPPVAQAPVETRPAVVPSPPKTPQQAPPAPKKPPTPPAKPVREGYRDQYGRYIGEITPAEKERWRQRMVDRIERRKFEIEEAKKPKPPTVLLTTAQRKQLAKGLPLKDPTPEEEEEEDEDEEEYDEEEEEYEEKEEIKEEPVKLREMPRRATLLVKEPARLPEETPKRRRKESESVEEAKEEAEDEEDEEFEQLEEEAKNLLNTTKDDESDTGSGSATPHREEDELTEEQATPGSSGKSKKAVKRKRMFNSRHSQMVVDKKYIKHKPKANHQHEESDDEEEEESTFNKESYVKRKNNMYKQLEAENKLDDCSSIGMECISKMAFPSDQIIPNYEAHLLKLRSIYASARQEIHILERQRRAQEEKKREVRDRERHLKESMSSPSQSSSSTATADST